MKLKIIDRPIKDGERKLQCCPYNLFSWYAPPPLKEEGKQKKKSKARKK